MERLGTSWQRRKDARPREITAAALAIFLEQGFLAGSMGVIAERAGLAKGSLYRYFASKEMLFRAVIADLTASGVEDITSLARGEQPFAEAVRELLTATGKLLSTDPVPAVIRLVVSEARTLPDIAAIWHDAVAAPVIATVVSLVVRGQERGEVVAGDPRVHALSVVGPLVMATLFREVFPHATGTLPAMRELAEGHANTVLAGLCDRK